MGTIGGAYLDTNFIAHGFLFRNGVFTTIDVPGALQTKIDSINELGELAGGYGLVDGTFHGFVATLESGQLNDTTMEPADAEPVNMSDVNSSRQ